MFVVYQDAICFQYLKITVDNLQQLHGRVIFVEYAKPRVDFRAKMPIARGPPDNC